jgi:hypothetical protein
LAYAWCTSSDDSKWELGRRHVTARYIINDFTEDDSIRLRIRVIWFVCENTLECSQWTDSSSIWGNANTRRYVGPAKGNGTSARVEYFADLTGSHFKASRWKFQNDLTVFKFKSFGKKLKVKVYLSPKALIQADRYEAVPIVERFKTEIERRYLSRRYHKSTRLMDVNTGSKTVFDFNKNGLRQCVLHHQGANILDAGIHSTEIYAARLREKENL